MYFVAFLFAILLLILIPLFSVFIQTIKNLLAFIALIIVLCINMMLFFHLEFFPIFLMLVYIGAIIVTTLFMVLTFDLRYENSRRIFHPRGVENLFAYFITTFVLYYIVLAVDRFLWSAGALREEDRIALYAKCLKESPQFTEFCAQSFGKIGSDKGLYHIIGEKTNDIVVISDNLYTTYGVLFIILGIILTAALLAAITLLKNGKSR